MATVSVDKAAFGIETAHHAQHADLAVSAPAGISALPSGFPTMLDERKSFTGKDFAGECEFRFDMTTAHLAEIDAALAHFKSLELNGDQIHPEVFPLPTLGRMLRDISSELYHGKGFSVIRGLNPKDYSVADQTMIYLGIQSYIADQCGRQDKRGNMLVHIIRDSSTESTDNHHRHSNKSITFHNEEAGDVVSWFTRSTASQGGECILASAYTVYNILAASRPDLVRVLARSDWPFAMPSFHCRPIIFYEDGRLVMNFGRAALLGSAAHPRPEHLPVLTAQQVEALDAIEEIAKATQVQFKTQAGDLHFINNLTVLHRREAFVDDSGKRHLVRMRLRSSEHARPLPAELQEEWDLAFQERGPRHWHLEAMPAHFFPMRLQPN